MPDLGTQLRDHYDSVVTLIDPEDIIEGRAARVLQRPPARATSPTVSQTPRRLQRLMRQSYLLTSST